MIAYLRQILGVYTPVFYQVWNETTQAFENVIPSGVAGVDWGYIFGGLIFIVVIYCLLKFLGALICKIF